MEQEMKLEEQVLHDADQLKLKLDEVHELFLRHKDIYQAVGTSLVISLCMGDQPIYLSAQGSPLALLQNIVKLNEKLKEDVWNKQNTKS